MKSKRTLALAASILALTLSAFPHHAAATSTKSQAPPPPPACHGTHIPTVIIEVASILHVLWLLQG
jgi:hypothetical protein